MTDICDPTKVDPTKVKPPSLLQLGCPVGCECNQCSGTGSGGGVNFYPAIGDYEPDDDGLITIPLTDGTNQVGEITIQCKPDVDTDISATAGTYDVVNGVVTIPVTDINGDPAGNIVINIPSNGFKKVSADGTVTDFDPANDCVPEFAFSIIEDHHNETVEADSKAKKIILDRDLYIKPVSGGTEGNAGVHISVSSLDSDDADTGSVTNHHTRSVLASVRSQSTGNSSANVASGDSVATSVQSANMASSQSTASGARSSNVASLTSTASGARSANMASENSQATASQSANVASAESVASGAKTSNVASARSTASGFNSSNVASSDAVASGTESGNFASNTSQATALQSANVGAFESVASGDRSANVATIQAKALATRSANMASENVEASASQSVNIASAESFAKGVKSANIASERANANAVNSSNLSTIDSTADGNNSANVASSNSKTATGAINSGNMATVDSEANSSQSANVATVESKATGNTSANIASRKSESQGTMSANVGSDESIAQGVRSVVVASKSTIAPNNNTFVMGFGAGAPSTANRTIELTASTGNAEFSGTVSSGVVFPGLAEYFLTKSGKNIGLGTIVVFDGNAVRPAKKSDAGSKFGIVRDPETSAFLGGWDGQSPIRYETGAYGQYIKEDGQRKETDAYKKWRENPSTFTTEKVVAVEILGRAFANTKGDVSVGDYLDYRGQATDEKTGLLVLSVNTSDNVALVLVN